MPTQAIECGDNLPFTRATHLDGRSWLVTVAEDCGLDPDGARALAAELLAAADLAEALRATDGWPCPTLGDVDLAEHDRSALVGVLRELTAHLREHDEPTWADQVAECRFLVEDGDPRGVTRLLGSLDGAGGLKELVLRVPRVDAADPAARAVHDRLVALLADAGRLAAALR